MHKLTCAMLLLAPLAMVGNVQAQNAAADRLAQFAQSDPQRRNAIAIGVLCFAGNRLSARLQDDCNNLVGNAFGADPGTDRARAALPVSHDASQRNSGVLGRKNRPCGNSLSLMGIAHNSCETGSHIAVSA